MLRWRVRVQLNDPLHDKVYAGDFYVYAERAPLPEKLPNHPQGAAARALAAAEAWARSNLTGWKFRDDYDRLPRAFVIGKPLEAPLMREA